MTSTTEEQTGFAELQLGEPILRAIADAGYQTPTAIQASAIPLVLAGRDLVGIAQTGTGKTAGFVLPMLQILSEGRARARMPRSLILSPTRELATQTAENFEKYGKHLSLTMALLIGGVGMGDQEKLLEKGVDVLIATPGRLLDWFDRGKVLLGGIQILVIDEADRMLDMGFIPDVERILSLIIGKRQTLLFSATMPPAISRLADRFLRDPERIEVARPATTSENVETWLVPASSESKRRALVKLIGQQGVGKAIVFSNRKRDVSSLCRYLQQSGLNARDIHGDLEQSHRQATLDAFKADQVDFLIATDVAARGLDISDMPVVINFDVPFSPDDYVHRIGRTGRAGKKGRAFTFATADEGRQVGAIERLTGKPIARLEIARGDEEQEEVQEERAPRPRRESSRRPAGQRAERRTDSAHRPERAAEPPADRRATHARSSSGRAQPSRTPAPPRPTPMIDGAPILAFGDHVPSFMLRAVPIAAPKKAEVETEAA